MILHRIHVESFKALRNPVELKDLGLGIHLIHGPNETGKSTLVAAIARGLFDRYSSTDQEIKRLRPWGTELSPRVTLEFETGDKTYRLDKKFLDEESSSLSAWNGQKFERVADSAKADDKVRGFMLGTAGKGATSLGNWGLARLLWMTQLPSRMAPPSLDEPLRQHLLGVLGSAVLSDVEQRLIARLDKAYDVFYTAAKQSEKKGSPLQEARERLAQADERLTQARNKWNEVSLLNETALEVQKRLSGLVGERMKIDSRIAELTARAKEELALENILQVKEQQLLVVQGKWKALNATQSEVVTLEQGIATHSRTQAALEPQIRQDETQLKQFEQENVNATLQLKAANDNSTLLAKEIATAALLADAKSVWQQKQDLTVTLEKVLGLEKTHAEIKGEYSSRKRPKDTDLNEIRAIQNECATLKGRLSDLGIEVTFVPNQPGTPVEWKTPDGVQTSSENGLVFRSLDQGELIIPGVGRVQVRSGAEDSKKLKARLNELEAKFQTRLSFFSTSSLEDLQALYISTEELKTSGLAARSVLNSALSGRFGSSADIASELEKLQAVLNRQFELTQMSEGDLAAQILPDVRALHSRALPLKQALDAAQRAKDALETNLKTLLKRLEESRAAFAAAQQGAELLGKQLAAKLAAAGGREVLERELHDVVLEKSALEKERTLLGSKLPMASQRASGQLAALALAHEAAIKGEEVAKKEFAQATALLANAQGEGFYSKLATAEEERALALEVVRRRETQAQGTRVLRALAHAKQDQMNSNLLTPIEAAVVEKFNYVRGAKTSSSRLAFGAELHELGVKTADEAAGAQGLETLSLGTQEQAMFALRLAFGELLSGRGDHPEPQLVILDDPLVNADPQRQERARELLVAASAKLQILILTARPEDYRMLPHKEYNLAALKN